MYDIKRGGLLESDAVFIRDEDEMMRSGAQASPGSPKAYVLDADAAGSIAMKAMTSGELRVVDTALAALYYGNSSSAYEMQAFTDTVVQFDKAISADGQYVLIDATANNGDGAALLAQLQVLGLQGGASFAGAASGWLPIAKIGELVNAGNIAMARQSVNTVNVGSVTTQADVSMGVDVARNTYGLNGAGVKIGTMSDSFNKANVFINGVKDDFQKNVDTGDLLPTTKVLQEYSGAGSDEGRAMAQLIQDLAPGADITFATAFGGQASFAQNIVDLAKAGNKVIVDDVRNYTELMYQNGPIAQAINQVTAEYNVVYFSSAGNQAAQGWQGDWATNGTTYTRNGVTYQLLSFGLPLTSTGGTPLDYLTLTGASGLFAIQWDQPSAIAGGRGSAVNVDVFVSSDTAGANVNFQSISNNIGNDAVEFINFGTTGATRYVRIGVPMGTQVPGNVRLVLSTGTVQNTTTNQNPGSGFGHSVAESAIGVGATPYYATPIYTDTTRINPATIPVPAHENFSSRGISTLVFDDSGNRRATPVLRAAAQISAADGGNTTFFTSDDADADNIPNFYGTSAAAPDAAAVAVLVRQYAPNMSSADILALMQAVAIDMDDRFTPGYDVGFDSRNGAGYVQADRVLRALIDKVIDNPTQPTLTGTSGGETINAGAGANTVSGGGGDDVIYGNAGNDVLNGDAGNDVLYGNADNDQLNGGIGDDQLFGGQGNDTLNGGTGDDLLEGGLGDDYLNGAAGINTATYRFAPGGVTVTLGSPSGLLTGIGTATGAAGNDTLVQIQNVVGSPFADSITGDNGNNVIEGGLGDDTLNGGAGTDTASYASATSGVTVNLALTTAQNTVGAGVDTLSNFERVVGSAFADTLTVGDGQTALGGGGDDRLYAPASLPSTTDAPDINKPASIQNNSTANAVNLNGAFDLVFNPNIFDSRTLPHATINATVGSTAELEYYAVQMAGPGRILIDVDAWVSTTDSVIQLLDANGTVLDVNDDASVDPGDSGSFPSNNSRIDFNVGAAGTYYVVIGGFGTSSTVPIAIPAGSTYTVHVSAAGQGVTYDGGVQSGGNASFYGEAGNDTLFSGLGDDLLNGGDGSDTASYANASAAVTVTLASQGVAQATGGAGSDTLVGIENLTGSNYADTLTGDDFANILSGGFGADTVSGGLGADILYGNQDADVLYGNQGNDILYGGQGDDVLYGGQNDDVLFGNAGADSLYGGVGRDVYKYSLATDSTAASFDTVYGFERFIDKIDFRDVIQGGAYSANITYATAGGVTTATVNLDLGNDGTVDMVVKVLGTGTTPITAADILFI